MSLIDIVCYLYLYLLCILGQAGKGNNEEFGLLSLEFDENFCMGGPGVILSSETLRRGILVLSKFDEFALRTNYLFLQ